MKCWYRFSSMLMVVALLASAAMAQQMTPWSQAPTAGAAMQTAPGGMYGAPGYGAASYGYGNNYGAPFTGTPMNGPANQQVQAPAYMAPAQTPIPGSNNVQAPAVTTYAAPSAAPAYTPQPPAYQNGPAVNTQACGGGVVDGGPAVSAPCQVAGPVYTGIQAAPSWGGPVIPAPAARACPRFFGGVYGLIMDRVDSDEVYFAVDPALPSRLYLTSRDASMETAGGFEVRLGKTFNCCRWGLEAVYWQLFPEDEFAAVQVANVPAPTIYMTPDYTDVWINYDAGPDTIPNGFNDGSIQTMEIRRSFDYRNLELNLLSGPLGPQPVACGGCDPCGGGGVYGGRRRGLRQYGPNCGQQPRWQAGWLFGVRYFKLDEDFMLAVDNGDGIVDYTYNGGDTEFFHDIDTSNDLVGVQLGMNLNYFLTKCFQLEAGSKFGLYGNHMTSYQRIFNTNGPAYVDPAAPTDFTVNASDDDIAFLGELRAGLGYKIGCHWRLTGGYRAVVASNVALPLHQLPVGRELGSLNKVGKINHDASLILHGAYAGAEFAW